MGMLTHPLDQCNDVAHGFRLFNRVGISVLLCALCRIVYVFYLSHIAVPALYLSVPALYLLVSSQMHLCLPYICL